MNLLVNLHNGPLSSYILSLHWALAVRGKIAVHTGNWPKFKSSKPSGMVMTFPASTFLPAGYVKLENNVIHSTFIENTQCTVALCKYWRAGKSAKPNPLRRVPARKSLSTVTQTLHFWKEFLGE